MPFAVYLDLDAAGSHDFDRIADAVERLGPDISTPRRLGHTHHITLAVYDQLDTDGMERALPEIASAALEIVFPAIGSFPGERSVLFAAPQVSEDLLALHERYHRLTAPYGKSQDYYRPGAWFPHMTLAVNLTRHDLVAALDAVAREWSPVTCALDTIRLVRLSPVETLFLWPLPSD